MARGIYRFFLHKDLPEPVRDRLLGKRLEHGGFLPSAIPGVFAAKSPRVLLAPLNCAWLLVPALQAEGIPFDVTAPKERPRVRWSDVVAATAGELRPWVPDFLLDYQKIGILTALNEPDESLTLSHPTGSGKSLSAIVWGVHRPGTMIILTKASNRLGFQREFQRYTTIEPLVMTPASERKAKDPDPVALLEDAVARGEPPRAIIVGYETLVSYLPLLLTVPYVSVVYDEIHKLQAWKRWAKVPQAMESAGERPEFRRLDNIVTSAARLGANAKRRIGATATWIPDRRRTLWSQLDMIHPRAWGKAWDFFHRFCDVVETNHGNLDNSGASNTDELKRRLSFVVHRVDSAVTRRSLPPCRRQVLYITKAQQGRPDAFAKELAKAMKSGKSAMREVRLAEAASRKRPVILDYIKDAVAGGSKIIVLTGRHADCERLHDGISKACPGVKIWVGHGDHSIVERDQIRDEYMGRPADEARGITALAPHPGPCILIGGAGAWGEAHNLQDTDLLIHAQLPINARELWQREGRVSRHGQKRPVLNLYPVAEGTYDEVVKQILLDKLPDVADLQGDSTFANAVADLESSGVSDEQVMDDLFAKIVGSETDE